MLDDLSEDKLRDFRRTVHYLHAHQFYAAGSARASAVLRVLSNPALRHEVEGHFDRAGYDFHCDEAESWYGVIPHADDVYGQKMTPTQTLVLLLLRVHWEKCAEAGDMDAKRQAVTTFNDLWTHAQEILSQEGARAPALDGDRLLGLLDKDFRRKGVVDFGESDPDTMNVELFIRPFITLLAGEDTLVRLGRFLDLGEEALRRADAEAAADDEQEEAAGADGDDRGSEEAGAEDAEERE